MRCNILIVGDSGTGKSSSIKNLNPKTTVLLNTEQKMLPFRQKFDKQVIISSFEVFEKTMMQLAKRDDIDTIVIDSLSALQEMLLLNNKKTKRGHDIYGHYNDAMREIMLAAKLCSDKFMIFTSLATTFIDDKGNTKMRAKIDGKALATSYIESCFTIVLHTVPKEDENGKIDYTFLTNTDGIRLCKSPPEMFDIYIPNDLQLVKDTIENYYKD